jgi:hypothetical protein
MVWPIPRRRSSVRFALQLYALSAITRSGGVRGRPGPARGTRMPASTAANWVVSWTWPPVTRTCQRPAAAVTAAVDLGRQPATRAAQRMIGWLVRPRDPVIR